MPKWTGKALAKFPSIPPQPLPCPPWGLPCPSWTTNWVPLGVGTPPFPQPPLRGANPVSPAFTFAPPSLPPTPSGSVWLEGASTGRGSGPDLNRLPGAQEGRGNLATLPFDPLPSQWSPNFPLQALDPFPSPSHPLGVPVPSCFHFYPLTPPQSSRPTRSLGVPPVPLGAHCPPPVPGMCPSCVETRILHPPSLPS